VPATQATDSLELAALFDPGPARVRAAREKFAVPAAFTDSEEFFRAGIDAVVVTSLAGAHARNVLDAARHGKHVLCEKPLALNEPDSQQLIAAMRGAGRMLFTAFCYCFSPCALRIKELIVAGAIGRPRSLRLVYLWNCPGKYERPGIIQKRREDRMLEDGPMIDCGVHQIDLARWWLGAEVVRQHAPGA
jgi:predicted dehydrogenase